jgi:hypothetical protein
VHLFRIGNAAKYVVQSQPICHQCFRSALPHSRDWYHELDYRWIVAVASGEDSRHLGSSTGFRSDGFLPYYRPDYDGGLPKCANIRSSASLLLGRVSALERTKSYAVLDADKR